MSERGSCGSSYGLICLSLSLYSFSLLILLLRRPLLILLLLLPAMLAMIWKEETLPLCHLTPCAWNIYSVRFFRFFKHMSLTRRPRVYLLLYGMAARRSGPEDAYKDLLRAAELHKTHGTLPHCGSPSLRHAVVALPPLHNVLVSSVVVYFFGVHSCWFAKELLASAGRPVQCVCVNCVFPLCA